MSLTLDHRLMAGKPPACRGRLESLPYIFHSSGDGSGAFYPLSPRVSLICVEAFGPCAVLRRRVFP